MDYILEVLRASCSFKICGMLLQRHAVIGRDRCAARGNVGRRASAGAFQPEIRGDRRSIGRHVVNDHSQGSGSTPAATDENGQQCLVAFYDLSFASRDCSRLVKAQPCRKDRQA
jgi:hypothetical protein